MRDFLDAIYRPQGFGFMELRAFGDGDDIRRAWYPYPDGLKDFVERANECNGSYNVFAGVLLREKQDIGTADNCKKTTPILWADFDTKVMARLNVFHEINQIEVPPQIMLDSGYGFHAYWLLNEAVSVDDAQDVMKNLAKRHGGDVVGDPARIMRVPGTLNIKDKLTPRPVRLVKFNPYERSRFSDFINYATVDIPYGTESAKDFAIAAAGATPTWIDNRLQECPEKGTRSEYIFGIICSMVRAKWPLDKVYEALLEAPAGEKIRELSMESGFRWVKTSYQNAMQAVSLES